MKLPGPMLFTLFATFVGVVIQQSYSDDSKPPRAKLTSTTFSKSEIASPTLTSEFGEIPVFPPDNDWNQPIDHLPVHPNSNAYLNTIGLSTSLHPDWGAKWNGNPVGIPVTIVRGAQPRVPVKFEYAEESDAGFYPIPDNVQIEGGESSDGDRHAIIVDADNGRLFELFNVRKTPLTWTASAGAIFDLKSNALRTAGWTSADAAGLPILPGLVRYDEVIEKKEIKHALRITVQKSQKAYIHPARHFASYSTDKNHIPMGLRIRLKKDFDISGFPEPVQVILKAVQKYGVIVADNGANLFITGTHDMRWETDKLAALKTVKASDLEAVFTGELTR